MAKTIADYKNDYEAAMAMGDVEGMKAANKAANTIRAETGGLQQDATEDIANMEARVNAVKAAQTPSAASVSGLFSAGSGAPTYEASALPAPSDYSSYISDMYKAKEDAALSGLETAYQQNMAELDAAKADITPAYQTARNKTAAQSEQSKRSFAEYANAYGLNSGTSGQAELARGVTLQNNLSSLNQAEADAFSELDLQRTRVANEYNAAIAAAKAGGAYDLAAALYKEAVRVDQSLVSNAISQAGLNDNKWSADYTAWQDARSRADTLAAQETSNARTAQDNSASYGKIWLQYGLMPSDSMLAAMGITKEEAQKLIDKINGA